jgi:tetratricopeptide (TPR) repeat protein
MQRINQTQAEAIEKLLLKQAEEVRPKTYLIMTPAETTQANGTADIAGVFIEQHLSLSKNWVRVSADQNALVKRLLLEQEQGLKPELSQNLAQNAGVDLIIRLSSEPSSDGNVLQIQTYQKSQAKIQNFHTPPLPLDNLEFILQSSQKYVGEVLNLASSHQTNQTIENYWKHQTYQNFNQTSLAGNLMDSNPVQSKIMLENVLKQAPQNHRALRFLSLVYLNENKVEEAIQLAKEALQLNPEYDSVVSQLGDIYYKQKNYHEALKYYHQAHIMDPNSLEYLDNTLHALDQLEPIEADYSSFPLVLRMRNLWSENANSHLMLGNLLTYQGLYEKAESEYQAAIRLNPVEAFNYQQLGLMYEQQSKIDLALETYTTGINLNAQNQTLLFYRSNIYYFLNKYQEAITDLDQLIGLDEKNEYYYYRRAKAHRVLGNYSDALKDLNQAISLNSNDVDFFTERSSNLLNLKNYAESIQDAKKALKMEPTNTSAWFNIAYAQSELNELDASLISYNTLLDLDPTYASAYNNRGVIHENKGLTRNAMTDYEQAIRFAPEYGMYYSNRGNIYRKWENCEKAKADFVKACELGYSEACDASCDE